MTKLRWAQFLLYKTTKNYAAAYRDDSLQHDDYVKGIKNVIQQTIVICE